MNAYFRPQLGIQIFVVPTWVIVCISIFTSFVQWLSVLVITHLALRVSSRMALLHDGVECDHQKSIECRLLGNWLIELCPCGFEAAIERPIQAASAGWGGSCRDLGMPVQGKPEGVIRWATGGRVLMQLSFSQPALHRPFPQRDPPYMSQLCR